MTDPLVDTPDTRLVAVGICARCGGLIEAPEEFAEMIPPAECGRCFDPGSVRVVSGGSSPPMSLIASAMRGELPLVDDPSPEDADLVERGFPCTSLPACYRQYALALTAELRRRGCEDPERVGGILCHAGSVAKQLAALDRDLDVQPLSAALVRRHSQALLFKFGDDSARFLMKRFGVFFDSTGSDQRRQ